MQAQVEIRLRCQVAVCHRWQIYCTAGVTTTNVNAMKDITTLLTRVVNLPMGVNNTCCPFASPVLFILTLHLGLLYIFTNFQEKMKCC